MKNVLVIRMSALGDVAMTIPIIYSVAKAYPQTQFVIITQPFPADFFINAPYNIDVLPIDIKKEYNGFLGTLRLAWELRKMRFDAVADLHDVLRSKIIRLLFAGIKCAKIDKGRSEKKALVKNPSQRKQLKSSFERYTEVFEELGFSFTPDFTSVFENFPAQVDEPWRKPSGSVWIGFAPFSKHKGKIYPEQKCKDLIQGLLAADPRYKVFLFGAGKLETEMLDSWKDIDPQRVVSLASKMKIRQEICFMSQLDVMISMDSANMHLASLVGIPVVSIWGATHPFAGFLGWNQDSRNALGLDIDCRPCSVFGNHPCKLGTYRCMNDLSEKLVIARIKALTEQNH